MPRPGKIWLPLDVNHSDDPDVLELSDLAELLDLRAMAKAKQLGSDGRLTLRQFQKIAPDSPPDRPDVIGELLASPLWIDIGDGTFERRSWLDWNDTAEDIEAMSRGGSKGNHKRWHVRGTKARPPKPDPSCEFCVADRLVSPPDSPPDSTAISDPIQVANPREDIDVDTDVDAYEDSNPGADTCNQAHELSAALADALGIAQSELTPSAKSSFEKAVADLTSVSALVEDVPRRVNVYRSKWPQAACTPAAIAKHWPQLTESASETELTPVRDVLAEFAAWGQKMAGRTAEQFGDLLRAKTTDSEEIESAWSGWNAHRPVEAVS